MESCAPIAPGAPAGFGELLEGNLGDRRGLKWCLGYRRGLKWCLGLVIFPF